MVNKNGTREVYIFFEVNEQRSDSGQGLRVTRIGTHALTDKSQATLWNRLSQHKGTTKSGGGNHRGSIFRLLVGTALIQDKNLIFLTWGIGSNATKETKNTELELEQIVSQTIGNMPFLYLTINDESSRNSMRGYIEKNSIALLSNYKKDLLDSASASWLGHRCDREKVRHSGLWNQRHVDDLYNYDFLDTFEKLVT